MRLLWAFKLEAAALMTVLAIGSLIGWATSRDSSDEESGYAVIAAEDLEPFRSAFNANSHHIRLVLLVGPT